MSNSSLVNYTKISPHKSSPRNRKIDRITIHHMAGNLSVETCGNVFQSRKASSNYGIGTDGRVGMYVEEKDRSWASSSSANDNRAVTIEVANNSGSPNWTVSDKALAKLIDLCTDICKRNGIKKLNYTGDTTGNLTMHKWFVATNCPGPYLESKFPYIASEVNKRLSDNKATENTTNTTNEGVATVNVTLNVLRNGSTGEQVKALQRMLYAMGYKLGSNNPIDGSFGSMTDAAVRAYQKNKGLTVDGIVGQQTWNKLFGK